MEGRPNVGKEGERRDAVEENAWVGVIRSQSSASKVHVARANTAVHLFTAELPWSIHQFYIDRLFRESVVKSSRAHE